jgi:hypothetical protein
MVNHAVFLRNISSRAKRLFSGAIPLRPGLIAVLLALCGAVCQGQTDSLARFGVTPEQEAAASEWLNDLYTFGVEIKGDSAHFNDETRRIVSDSLYRSVIFPKTYSWGYAKGLMESMALKPFFWYMINLYHTDTARRDLVLKMVLPFDGLMEMDRILVATYYTYIAFDPEVYTVVNGKTTEVRRPDIAEQKLLATKAMVDQILLQRSLRAGKRD